MRFVVPVTLLLSALVCGYFFLANFEYRGVTWGKVVWGTLGAAFVVGALAAVRKRDRT